MPSAIEKFLDATTAGLQELEDAFQALLTECDIETAIGAPLDQIGLLVGQARDGLDDEPYRNRIRARIAVNRSKGAPLDVIKVTRLVLYAFEDLVVEYDNQGIATFVIRAINAALSEDDRNATIGFLRLAKAGGVRVIFESTYADPDSLLSPQPWFIWDTDGHGWDEGYFFDAVD